MDTYHLYKSINKEAVKYTVLQKLKAYREGL